MKEIPSENRDPIVLWFVQVIQEVGPGRGVSTVIGSAYETFKEAQSAANDYEKSRHKKHDKDLHYHVCRRIERTYHRVTGKPF